MNVLRKAPIAILALAFLLALAPEKAAAASKSKVDINSASQAELEALPGVGATTARKIIGGRPYRSVGDLSKAGVSESTIHKISGLVTVGRGSAASAPAPAREPRTKADASRSSRAAPGGSSSSSTGLVDLNRASEKELEALPGVGAVTARKIIAGRPYSSVGDLSSAGVSASTISKISPLVTVSAASNARSSRPAPARESVPASASSPAPAPAPPSRASDAPAAPQRRAPSSSSSSEYQAPPSSGMVWVNLDTKIFHREGDRWYGRTKHGKYMSEADALNSGYRLSREKGEPGPPR